MSNSGQFRTSPQPPAETDPTRPGLRDAGTARLFECGAKAVRRDLQRLTIAFVVQAGRRFNDTKRLWLRYTARETFLCQIRLPGGEDIYAKTAELGGKMTKRGTPRTSVRSGNRRPGRTARQS
jgi:hypothetical protein